MALRAKKPSAVEKRLKIFMYGPAGVGKTTASIQFPNSYIIDCERGCENYDKLITASGSVVFQTTDIYEIIREVQSLQTTRHEYRTLVIDPITTAFAELIDKAEDDVGSAHGKHYGVANKVMKRLANLLMGLDMNIVVTSHAKDVIGANMAKTGSTFDAWKRLDYLFDLVVELSKNGKKRMGKVVKTRIETFPDESTFEWNYAAIADRYGRAVVERTAEPETPMDDVEAFRIVLREALESRGFTKDQMKQAAGAILKKYEAVTMADLTPEQRVEALDAVGAGKLDKYMGEPAAV